MVDHWFHRFTLSTTRRTGNPYCEYGNVAVEAIFGLIIIFFFFFLEGTLTTVIRGDGLCN